LTTVITLSEFNLVCRY